MSDDKIEVRNPTGRPCKVIVDGEAVEVPAGATLDVERVDVMIIGNPSKTKPFKFKTGGKVYVIEPGGSASVPRAALAALLGAAEAPRRPQRVAWREPPPPKDPFYPGVE